MVPFLSAKPVASVQLFRLERGMSTWATWAIVIAMNAICYVAITHGAAEARGPDVAHPLLVLAVAVPIALLGVYRAELSTAAALWLVFAIALAVPIALLFRLAIPEQWQRNGTFASVAVLTLGIYQFATKGFRPDTFDFWFAVITMSVGTVDIRFAAELAHSAGFPPRVTDSETQPASACALLPGSRPRSHRARSRRRDQRL